jgi:serine/threonine protein kinase
MYLAEHIFLSTQTFQKLAAIKIQHSWVTNIEQFRNEALIIARLNHPNIVSFDTFSVAVDGTPYLVMEDAVGSLSQCHPRHNDFLEKVRTFSEEKRTGTTPSFSMLLWTILSG